MTSFGLGDFKLEPWVIGAGVGQGIGFDAAGGCSASGGQSVGDVIQELMNFFGGEAGGSRQVIDAEGCFGSHAA